MERGDDESQRRGASMRWRTNLGEDADASMSEATAPRRGWTDRRQSATADLFAALAAGGEEDAVDVAARSRLGGDRLTPERGSDLRRMRLENLGSLAALIGRPSEPFPRSRSAPRRTAWPGMETASGSQLSKADLDALTRQADDRLAEDDGTPTRAVTLALFCEADCAADGADAGEEAERPPQELSTRNQSRFVTVEKDRCTVRYVGRGNHAHDVGAVQASAPFPARAAVPYFEMQVRTGGRACAVSIGLTQARFAFDRHPGWEDDSFGYHAETGRVFSGSSSGTAYGPGFAVGDTVGCGVLHDEDAIFFTKNGRFLGKAFSADARGELIPTVGLHSPGEVVRVNFGARDFVFDLDAFIAERVRRRRRDIAATALPPTAATQVVRQYLLHHGHVETLAALDRMFGPVAESTSPVASMESSMMEKRVLVRTRLEAGDVPAALAALREHFPHVAMETTADDADVDDAARYALVARHVINCQAVIEHVRAGSLGEAMAHARAHLREPVSGRLTADLLPDTLSLLAYENPSEAPAAYLLEQAQRVRTADVVNSAILASQGFPPRSALETIVRQVYALDAMRLETLGNKGAPVGKF